ncbi:MAG: prolyl oligopeptidase family serine peptidase [Bacteroidota bacterium]
MKKSLIYLLATCSILACTKPEKVMEVKLKINQNIQDTSFQYFGVTVHDPFFGLEDDHSDRTKKWVLEQQAQTNTYFQKHEETRTQIEERYRQIFNFEKVSAPEKEGEYYFFWRNSGLQPQSVCYVRKGTKGTERVFIDPNQIDPNGTTTFNLFGANDDHTLMAVSISKAGSDWSTIEVWDIESGKPVEEPIEWVKFSGVSWFGNGFFYSKYPAPKNGDVLKGNNLHHSVYFHQIGSAPSTDKLVYSDAKNATYYNNAALSEDKQFLFITSAPGTDGYLVYFKHIAQNSVAFQPLFTDLSYHSNVVEVALDGKLIVLTDVDAPTYRLVKVDPYHPEPSNWETLIPAEKRLLQNVTTCGNKLFLHYLENANTRIESCDYNGKNRTIIQLPDATGTADGFSGKRTDEKCYFTFTSFTYPGNIYEYSIASGEIKLYHSPNIDIVSTDYESKQVWVPSRDGKNKISLFIVHKKGVELNGENPTLLYGYGGFNVSLTPSFSSSRMILLEQGGVFALANIRGGGEFGEEWHQDGMRLNKQNVFNDFIDCAEYLIQTKYTSNSKLAIEGGSNGGLLVGACMTQRPDLFQVAFPAVGVLDMLRFQEFTVGKGWIPEYGSSKESKSMFEYLLAYSPYHNLKPNTNYPATMVMTADHDDRVVPAHSFKFAAMLQECTTNERPSIIRVETSAGHGAGKSTNQIIQEQTDKWTFFFKNVNHNYIPLKH